MGRRFPPPLYGTEELERRSEEFVALALDASEPLSRSALVERTRDRLTKPEGGTYSEGYLRRILSTYVQLGVLRDTSDGLTTYQFAVDWQAGDIDFETFLWYGIKRAWAIEGDFPEGIEGIYHLHRVVQHAEEPLSQTAIRDRLADTYRYEFNDQDIRGYPRLLVGLGALEATEDGYVTTDPDRYSERFRNADLLWQFEQWLKREGPNTDPPPDRVKRDLAKYYMYRESGGYGRHKQLLATARSHYLDDSVAESDHSQPRLRRSEPYLEQRRHRKSLRERIIRQFPDVTPQDLAGLSTDVLERFADATSQREVYRIKAGAGTGLSRTDVDRMAGAPREPYSFPEEFELYDWQREASGVWFETGKTSPEAGIAQVVTGAGKTVMALEIVREWVNENPDGVVTVVVPTKVLLRQWISELVETLNVPADDIGWAGGGHKDSFEDGYRVLVTIVNTAVKDNFLQRSLESRASDSHLLIADECHRYTGDKFSEVFECERTASLGLSATPFSDPSSDDRSPEDELLVDALGDVYYELSYDEGLDRGLIPPFRINYVGFDLTDAERAAYEALSQKVSKAVRDIERQYQHRLYELSGSFARKLQVIRNGADGPTPAIGDYFEYTQERRELIADAVARQAITLRLLENVVTNEQKAIVFQERIDQLEQMVAPKESRGQSVRDAGADSEREPTTERAKLYERYPELKDIDTRLEDLFFRASYRPVMYHSGHRSEAWNDFAVEWFDDDGFANVMLSVKALIEGVDVPSADIGIVRVSSGSVRQRIQTLGRVLRTGGNPEERSELFVLYARDTVDENIFEKYDWRQELGSAEIRHLRWQTSEDSIDGALVEVEDGTPTPVEVPEAGDLNRGEQYPVSEFSSGVEIVYEFSVDANGEPFRKRGDGRELIRNDACEEIAEFVHREKGGGSVRVTDAGHALTRVDEETIFVGVAPDKADLISETTDPCGLTGPVDDEDLL